jgi:hypothetical protein
MAHAADRFGGFTLNHIVSIKELIKYIDWLIVNEER